MLSVLPAADLLPFQILKTALLKSCRLCICRRIPCRNFVCKDIPCLLNISRLANSKTKSNIIPEFMLYPALVKNTLPQCRNLSNVLPMLKRISCLFSMKFYPLPRKMLSYRKPSGKKFPLKNNLFFIWVLHIAPLGGII